MHLYTSKMCSPPSLSPALLTEFFFFFTHSLVTSFLAGLIPGLRHTDGALPEHPIGYTDTGVRVVSITDMGGECQHALGPTYPFFPPSPKWPHLLSKEGSQKDLEVLCPGSTSSVALLCDLVQITSLPGELSF